jgi:DNA-binding phage protein
MLTPAFLINRHKVFNHYIKAAMASEDKTHCGQAERDPAKSFDEKGIAELANKLGISAEDIIDAIDQLGNDREKVEAFFKSKENSY